jgi:hypothetical protein
VAGWATIDPQTKRVYIYRAVMKNELTDTEQARLMNEMTPPDERITVTYASPDMWARKTQGNKVFTSIDEYKSEGVLLTRADNDRLNGKRKIDRLLMDLLDGKPSIQIFEPYYNVFKCMTTVVRDDHNPEDVKKVDGDDPYDMLRYILTNHNQAEKKVEAFRHPLQGDKSIW